MILAAARAAGTATALLLLAGCTAAPEPSSDTHSADCLEGTGKASVSDGVLTMGPFTRDTLNTSHAQQAKVWLGTTERGVTGDAMVTVSGPGGVRHEYVRQPATTGGFRAFYPGLIDVPHAGSWTITGRAGSHRICVRVDYE